MNNAKSKEQPILDSTQKKKKKLGNTEISKFLSIVTLNVNGLIYQVKKHK
jgi:hypothetical protein